MALDIRHVTKSFGSFTAVRDVSFTVEPGRIFGFLGTNGAGKTTTMRLILDILRPDAGEITWNGRPNSAVPRRDWGYLPEERGLYPKMTVEAELIFLAKLFGADERQIRPALDEWLQRLDIAENRHKRVEQLSKGNQQKIQFLAAVLHDPEILILDEPFSGLDPVNAEQLKQAFVALRERGKTMIFSTHQLEQAEELCQDVAIIHRGALVAYGDVRDVRRGAGLQIIRLAIAGDPQIAWLDAMPGARVRHRRPDYVELEADRDYRANDLLQAALARGAEVTRFEIAEPSLNDIFLARVGERVAPGGAPDPARAAVAAGGAA